MLNHLNIENILILDIECVSGHDNLNNLSEGMRKMWLKKARQITDEDSESNEVYFHNAGIYAEFGKVICISVGVFVNEPTGIGIRIKSFAGNNEKEVLGDFIELLDLKYNNPSKQLICGHNIKEFDVPYICRRALINGLRLPKMLDIAGAKPWEVPHLDTMQLWKFGDYKNYTSLNLLANVFGIPTPKDDIDGSQVAEVYWKEDNLERIVTYCQKDVLTTGQLLLRYKGMPLIKEENVTLV